MRALFLRLFCASALTFAAIAPASAFDGAADPDGAAPVADIAVVKNLKRDFGAKGDGVADDSPAFRDFRAWAIAWQTGHSGRIRLELPPGVYRYAGAYDPWIVKGIKKLVVDGPGATLKVATKPANLFLGGVGIRGDALPRPSSARVASVSAGSAAVTLLRREQASLFSVGDYALMAGLDMMGYGFPINPYFFQYVKIAAIDKGKGVVRFEEPLKDGYSASWPHYSSGSLYAPDQGGPATLYALDPSWDTEVEYRGLTIDQPGQIYASGRRIVFADVQFPDGCPIPSQAKSWIADRITMTASPSRSCAVIEADKLVEEIRFDGGAVASIGFQSASIERLLVRGTVFSGGIFGTPKRTVIADAKLGTLAIGTPFFGATSEVECVNSVVRSLPRQPFGVTERVDDIADLRIGDDGAMIFRDRGKAKRWAIPGAKMFWTGAGSNLGPTFVVKDIREEGGKIVVRTDLPAGAPSAPRGTRGELGVRVHPAWRVTFRNCTGSPDVEDLSGAPAGQPLYSYSKRIYSAADDGDLQKQPYLSVWGRLVGLKATVLEPSAGAGNADFLHIVLQTVEGGKTRQHALDVDLRTAGERVVEPAQIGGARPGDKLHTLPADAWIMLGRAFLYKNKSAAAAEPATLPVVSVEFVTDQSPR
jgi:hypothetical protein